MTQTGVCPECKNTDDEHLTSCSRTSRHDRANRPAIETKKKDEVWAFPDGRGGKRVGPFFNPGLAWDWMAERSPCERQPNCGMPNHHAGPCA